MSEIMSKLNKFNAGNAEYNIVSHSEIPKDMLPTNEELQDDEYVFNAKAKNVDSDFSSYVKQTITQGTIFENDYKVLGVLFSTYILVQTKDAFYIIDQHAAHERYLYDEFMGEISRSEVALQDLLVPYTIMADNDMANFLDSNAKELNELGFGLETFGNNIYKVETVPLILSDIDLKAFFDDIYQNKSFLANQGAQLKEKIATRACKSAIKAGMTLNDSEIEKLVGMIKESNSPLFCPHGRPYVLKVTKKDIEKWFKRTV